jgi:hypothetical protein
MENPLGGMEIFVGGLTALIGFGAADFADRMIATHALTDKNAQDANGVELWADNPPTTGSYSGLFNATAVCAPMNAMRWVSGGLITIVPLTLAQWVRGPTAKSSLQMFGFGAGVRTLGKGLIDLVAVVARKSEVGQRLYDGELRANSLNGGTAADTTFPSAGLGRVPRALGAGAPKCRCGGSGVGCCSVAPQAPTQPPGQTATPPQPMTTQVTPPVPPAPPAPPTIRGLPSPAQSFAGAAAPPKARNHFLWGESSQ